MTIMCGVDPDPQPRSCQRACGPVPVCLLGLPGACDHGEERVGEEHTLQGGSAAAGQKEKAARRNSILSLVDVWQLGKGEKLKAETV